MIRNALPEDLPAIVTLHRQYLGEYFLARLGEAFLQLYYREFLNAPSCRILLWENTGQIRGYIVASRNPALIIKKMAWGRSFAIIKELLKHGLKHPEDWIQIFELALYPQKTTEPQIKAELLYIALDAGERKSGAAETLVLEALTWLEQQGETMVKVSTASDNRGANLLLHKLGFSPGESFRLNQKLQNLYLGEIKTILSH